MNDNQDKKSQRVGDGRVFFRYLLEHFGPKENHNATAQRVLSIGQEKYGAERDSLAGKHLRSWADGTRIVPKWAYSAALDLCLESGFEPESGDQVIACWKTWQSTQPEKPLPALMSEFRSVVPLTEEQESTLTDYLGLTP